MARVLWRDRFRRLWLGLRALAQPGKIERELEEELRFHCEWDPRERGRLEATKEAYRQAGDLYGLQTLARDVHYGARLLRRSPLFTSVAVVTLGVGIGLNVALFSVVNAVLLRPLPYAQPGQLVTLGASSERRGAAGQNVGWMTAEDWKRQSHSFRALATYFPWSPVLTLGTAGSATAQVVVGQHVSANFFPALGVAPLLGRNFTAGEDRPQRNHEVLLSYEFWRSRFGGDRGVLGRTLQFDHISYQILGVMPANFDSEPFRPQVEVWTPMGYDASIPDACRGCQHLKAIGRLAPGISLASTRREMNAIEIRLAAAYPTDYPPDATVWIAPLRDSVVGGVSAMLWMLLGAAGLVLLLVCVNLTHLLLVRAALRRGEMAMRAALGAPWGRLLRQTLTEGALLGLLGGTAGVVLAYAVVRALRSWLLSGPAGAVLPRLQDLRVDPRALLFALAVSLAAGILASLVPALQSARAPQAEALRNARAQLGGGRPRRSLEKELIALEVALAMMLAVTTGLVLKSFVRVLEVSPGFQPHQVFTADFVLSGPAYTADATQNRFAQQLLDRLEARPELQAAGLVSVLPLDPGNYDTRGFLTLDPPITSAAAMMKFNNFYDTYFVSSGYFAAMGIALRRGRYFTGDDIVHPLNAVIVDESLARKLWPGQDPIGKAIMRPPATGTVERWSRVVGMVDDVHQYGMDQAPTPEVYLPYTANPGDATTLVVRSALPSSAVAQLVQSAVADLDPAVPLENGRTMDDLLHGAVAQRRITLDLIALFGALALALAALGIYGVVAYTTVRRTGEIGMRIALGASGSDIRKLVLTGGMAPALSGLALGTAGALAAGRWLTTLMYQVEPDDPATFLLALAVLAAVALTACWLPAWRASRLDPARALRAE